MTATAPRLSSECWDDALLQLSTEIAGYDRYKHRLGLSDAEIGAIDHTFVGSREIPRCSKEVEE